MEWNIERIRASAKNQLDRLGQREDQFAEWIADGPRTTKTLQLIDSRVQDTLENARQALQEEAQAAADEQMRRVEAELVRIPHADASPQIDRWRRELHTHHPASEDEKATADGDDVSLDDRIAEVRADLAALKRTLQRHFLSRVLLTLNPSARRAHQNGLNRYLDDTMTFLKLSIQAEAREAERTYVETLTERLDALEQRLTERERVGAAAREMAVEKLGEVEQEHDIRPYDFTLDIFAEAQRTGGDPDWLARSAQKIRELLIQGDQQAQGITRQALGLCKGLFTDLTRISLVQRLEQLKSSTETLEQFFRRVARRYTIPFTGLNSTTLSNPPHETMAFAVPENARHALPGINAVEHHDEQRIVALLAMHQIPPCALTCASDAAAAVKRREHGGERIAFPQRDWETRFDLDYDEPWDAEGGNWILLGIAAGLIDRQGSWFHVNGTRVNGSRKLREYINSDLQTRQAIIGHWRQLYAEEGIAGALEALEHSEERLLEHGLKDGDADSLNRNALKQDLHAMLEALRGNAPDSPQGFENVILHSQNT